MDPAAQTNPLDASTGLANPGPIQPGQFVVAEQTNHSQPPAQPPPEPKSETANPYMPPANPAPVAGSPEELLQNITQASGGSSPDLTQPPAPINPPNPELATTPMVESPAPAFPTPSPIESALPAENASIPNGPDPTPFSPNESMAAPPIPPAPSSGGDKIKVLLLVIGAFALIGIIGASAWYFVLNKPTEDIKTENLASEIETDIPQLPKRTNGGFSSLPLPSTIEASPTAGLETAGSELTSIENSLNSSNRP